MSQQQAALEQEQHKRRGEKKQSELWIINWINISCVLSANDSVKACCVLRLDLARKERRLITLPRFGLSQVFLSSQTIIGFGS